MPPNPLLRPDLSGKGEFLYCAKNEAFLCVVTFQRRRLENVSWRVEDSLKETLPPLGGHMRVWRRFKVSMTH